MQALLSCKPRNPKTSCAARHQTVNKHCNSRPAC
jgi:hypothetical protein